jgi:hypothetical protein
LLQADGAAASPDARDAATEAYDEAAEFARYKAEQQRARAEKRAVQRAERAARSAEARAEALRSEDEVSRRGPFSPKLMSLYDRTRAQLDELSSIATAYDDDDDGSVPRWLARSPSAPPSLRGGFMARHNERERQAKVQAARAAARITADGKRRKRLTLSALSTRRRRAPPPPGYRPERVRALCPFFAVNGDEVRRRRLEEQRRASRERLVRHAGGAKAMPSFFLRTVPRPSQKRRWKTRSKFEAEDSSFDRPVRSSFDAERLSGAATLGRAKRDVTATLLAEKGEGAEKHYLWHEKWFDGRGAPNARVTNLAASPSEAKISFGDSVERPMNVPTPPPAFDVPPRDTLPSFVRDPSRRSATFSDPRPRTERPHWIEPERGSDSPGHKYRVYHWTRMAGEKRVAPRPPAFGTTTKRDLAALPQPPPETSAETRAEDPRLADNWTAGLRFGTTPKRTLPELDPKRLSRGQNTYYAPSLHASWPGPERSDEALEAQKEKPFGRRRDSRLPEVPYDGREPKDIVPHSWIKGDPDEPMAIFATRSKRELTFSGQSHPDTVWRD